MRKCRGKYMKYNGSDGAFEQLDFEEGVFHQWGVDCEEYENGAASFTVGIVELPDGSVIMPLARWIQFID